MSFETLLRFGNFRAGQIETEATEGSVFRCKQGQERLKNLELEFYRRVQKIRSDTTRTAEGHTNEIKKAGENALKQLDASAKDFLDPAEQRLDVLRKELRLDVPPIESATSTLREIEVRNHILGMDKVKRYAVLEKAVNKKDEVIFRAFVNAPDFLELLSPKIIEQAKQLWAEQQNPSVAKELKELTIAAKILTESFEETYQGIGELGQITDDSMRTRLQRIAQTGLDQAAARYQQHRLATQTTDTAGNPMNPNDKVLNT
jgi:hypothetical protein